MAPEAVKATSSKWSPHAASCWSAVISEAKFRAIAIIYNRGAPGPRHNIDKELRGIARGKGVYRSVLAPERRGATMPTNFADFRSRGNFSAQATSETYNYQEFSPLFR